LRSEKSWRERKRENVYFLLCFISFEICTTISSLTSSFL
jgi:hypothetical protein